MRRILAALAFIVACAAAPAHAQNLTLPPDGDNQRASVSQWMGPVKVTVDYHSPDVHGPQGEDRAGHIWGELVPYGLHDLGFGGCTSCPWRAGANENTVFTVSHDVEVEGQPLPAGAYGVHMLAGADQFTIIFSRNSTSWGSFTYDPKEDALRVNVKPEAGEYHEWLTYEFTDRMPDQTTCALAWEKLRIPFTVRVPRIQDLYVAAIERDLRGEAWFTWTNWEKAARYCLTHKTHLDKGLEWAETAIHEPVFGTANFTTLTTLAQLQLATGRRAEATKSIDQAFTLSGLTPITVHTFARQLQGQGEKEFALKVFHANAKRFPNRWPVNLGLARAYAESGDKAKALSYAKQALKDAPDEPNRKNIENLMKQWSGPEAASN
jgi:hypothetical protein